MKPALILGLLAVLGLAVYGSISNEPYQVVNEKVASSTATTTMEVVEDLPEEWLEEAEAARQAVIDRKRAEAELDDVQSQIEALRVRETELEKELGTY